MFAILRSGLSLICKRRIADSVGRMTTTRTTLTALALALASVASTGSVLAQPATTGAGHGERTQQAPAPDALHRFTHWLDRSVTDVRDGFKRAVTAVQQAGDRTHDAVKGAAADATGRLGSLQHLHMQVVAVRQRCVVAANGAPDCRRTAEAICRAHGFASGKSLEIQSAEKCPLTALIGGRGSSAGECHTETYILRSVCQ
jgi:hypothetical protein